MGLNGFPKKKLIVSWKSIVFRFIKCKKQLKLKEDFMFTNNSRLIRNYKNKNGETHYMFSINLGVDHSTNKEKRTTRRGFKSFADAETAYHRLIV
ncbi:Arm DNA-binding domain-containing protein [Solibacillus silvestris]|uniref:Arm DNA-binding domain-containing protein n=1 Tax=Solibacillus silvestris TaxID=76853 RepID=UPI003F81A558